MLGGWGDAAAAVFEIVRDWFRRSDRADAESAGAAKQRAEDDKQALDAKDEQLREAVHRRPGDARRKLRSGDF